MAAPSSLLTVHLAVCSAVASHTHPLCRLISSNAACRLTPANTATSSMASVWRCEKVVSGNSARDGHQHSLDTRCRESESSASTRFSKCSTVALWERWVYCWSSCEVTYLSGKNVPVDVHRHRVNNFIPPVHINFCVQNKLCPSNNRVEWSLENWRVVCGRHLVC